MRAVRRRAHIPALDGLRGIAILLVMALHLIIFEPKPGAEDVLWKLAGAGWMGVDLFFVLSGFLITGILLDAKGRDGYFRTFYWRRSLRIFPLYYGYLVVLFFVCPLFYRHDPDAIKSLHDAAPWYWTYAVNLRVAMFGWNPTRVIDWTATPFGTGKFWSLAVEEQFYLLWPFVVFSLTRTSLVRVCAGMMVVAFILRAALAWVGAGSMVAFVLMPTRMDALAAGALVAIAARCDSDLAARLKPLRYSALYAAGVLGFIVVRDHGFKQWLPWMDVAGFSAVAVLCAWLVAEAVAAAEGDRLTRALCVAPLRAFGRYGYGLYVFHNLAPVALAALGVTVATFPLVGGSQLPRVLLFALLSVALAFVFAWVSWHGYEKHFLKLKDRVPASSPRVALTPEGTT